MIAIDTFHCNGCATCHELCPEVFVLNPDSGKAELVSPDPPVTEAVLQAAAYCPTKCIEIENN
ncbi:MAG: ferredoxin [Desulfobulbus sp.]|jgi:ferredoxin